MSASEKKLDPESQVRAKHDQLGKWYSCSFTIVSIIAGRSTGERRTVTITISGLVAKWPARAIKRLQNNGCASFVELHSRGKF